MEILSLIGVPFILVGTKINVVENNISVIWIVNEEYQRKIFLMIRIKPYVLAKLSHKAKNVHWFTLSFRA